MLPDRPEARERFLCASRIAKAAHASFALACRLVAVLGPVVQSRCRFDEDVLYVHKFWDLSFCRRIAAQLVGDDFARHRVRTRHTLEEAFGSGFVAPLLHRDVEFGTMLVHRSPKLVRLAAQGDEHLVEVPSTTGLAPRGFDSVSKALAEFVAPATDRLVGHDHPALEEQFLDVTQAQLKAKIPAHGATDDVGRKTVTVIERFRFLHRDILRDRPNNLTMLFNPFI